MRSAPSDIKLSCRPGAGCTSVSILLFACAAGADTAVIRYKFSSCRLLITVGPQAVHNFLMKARTKASTTGQERSAVQVHDTAATRHDEQNVPETSQTNMTEAAAGPLTASRGNAGSLSESDMGISSAAHTRVSGSSSQQHDALETSMKSRTQDMLPVPTSLFTQAVPSTPFTQADNSAQCDDKVLPGAAPYRSTSQVQPGSMDDLEQASSLCTCILNAESTNASRTTDTLVFAGLTTCPSPALTLEASRSLPGLSLEASRSLPADSTAPSQRTLGGRLKLVQPQDGVDLQVLVDDSLLELFAGEIGNAASFIPMLWLVRLVHQRMAILWLIMILMFGCVILHRYVLLYPNMRGRPGMKAFCCLWCQVLERHWLHVCTGAHHAVLGWSLQLSNCQWAQRQQPKRMVFSRQILCLPLVLKVHRRMKETGSSCSGTGQDRYVLWQRMDL